MFARFVSDLDAVQVQVTNGNTVESVTVHVSLGLRASLRGTEFREDFQPREQMPWGYDAGATSPIPTLGGPDLVNTRRFTNEGNSQ